MCTKRQIRVQLWSNPFSFRLFVVSDHTVCEFDTLKSDSSLGQCLLLACLFGTGQVFLSLFLHDFSGRYVANGPLSRNRQRDLRLCEPASTVRLVAKFEMEPVHAADTLDQAHNL